MSKYAFVVLNIISLFIGGCKTYMQINTYSDYLNWKYSNELKQGFYRKVELMIERGSDLNNVFINGKRLIPLIYSIQQQNHNVARLLIDKGADLNNCDQQGNTPLMWAITMRDFKLAELMLEKRADVKIVNKDNKTVLDFAAQNNSPFFVFEKLFEKEAPLSKDTLEIAINKKCRYDVIKLLLLKSKENNRNVKIGSFFESIILNELEKIRDIFNKTNINFSQSVNENLSFCAGLGYGEQLDLFYKNGYKFLYNEHELTLAQIASEYGQLNILKKLVSLGININEVYLSETPLLIGIKNNNKDVVDYLLSTGVTDFSIKNDYDRSMYNNDILLYACRYSDIEMIQLLKKYNIFFRNNKNGVIPVTILENNNCLQLIDYLSNYGFDINQYNKSFGSLLIFATAPRIDKNLFEWLVDHSNIIEDRNPISSLITYGENEKLKYLLESGWQKTENKFLFDAIWEANLPALKILVEHGLDIHEKYSDGGTVLYHAAKKGYDDIVKYLLNIGVDINEQTKDGDTALTIACKNYQLEVVDVLLNHNADKEIRNNEKKNAIEIANQLGFKLIENILNKGT
jgi:ankyrin repeat protein